MSAETVDPELVPAGKCPACGSNLVPRSCRRPRAEGYFEDHCAPCATGIERRAEK